MLATEFMVGDSSQAQETDHKFLLTMNDDVLCSRWSDHRRKAEQLFIVNQIIVGINHHKDGSHLLVTHIHDKRTRPIARHELAVR